MYTISSELCSSLEKVFSTDSVFPPSINRISAPGNSRAAFQLVVKTGKEEPISIGVDSELECTVFCVKEIPSAMPLPEDRGNTAVVGGALPGLYPDLLIPYTGEVMTQADKATAIWIEVYTGTKPGDYDITVKVTSELAEQEHRLTVTVAAAEIKKQTLKHINWFHTDCLLAHYNTPVFSEDYWRIVENFATNAYKHGVNVLFTPLFTPPLDTEEGGERPTVQLVGVRKTRQQYSFDFSKLDRWVDMAHRIGFEYFELSHLFTQWGAKHAPKIIADTIQGERRIFGWETKSDSEEYETFLKQFGAALTEYTDKKGITDKCYVHCSDEPGASDLHRYKKPATMINEYFGAFTHIDALSDYSFYKSGLIDLPVPSEAEIDRFAGKVPELWTYYCCGPYKDNYPNRFFALPSIKNRILGTLLYKYDCKGFLHWGFNFWFTQYSKAQINPFEVSDAGGAFSSGDAFIVYPGEDGMPLSSLRQKVFYNGIEDYEMLRLIEELSSREETLKLIEQKLGNITFTEYPLDNAVFESFIAAAINRINELVKEKNHAES